MRRNTLTTAVLAGLTGVAGMAGVANAVNVNPDGLGQVLLYPYYSARGGNSTLVSIVNTTERGKAVKIRFIEALNSREVLDFNIYMSPFDVWTAAIVGTDEGGAKLTTTDTTCTVPYIFGDFDGEQEFLTFEFTGERADGGPTGVERTASGYIEVIEMATMLPVPATNPGVDADGFVIPWVTKHVAGTPRDCSIPVLAWTETFSDDNLPWIDGDVFYGFDTELGATGGIFGSASIINVAEGTMFSYNATAIDGFYDELPGIHSNPGDLFPNLASGDAFESNIFVNGDVVTHDWFGAGDAAAVGAVNAVLTHRQIFNEYITDPEIGARTEWVVTFPTKRFHTDGLAEAVPPFTDTWNNGSDFSPACEAFAFTTPTTDAQYYATEGSRAFDREEGPGVTPEDDPDPIPPVVSPRPPADPVTPVEPDLFLLCREANVIRFALGEDEIPGASEILQEPWRDGDGLGFSNFALPFDAGWVRFDLGAIGDTADVRTSLPGQTPNGAFEAVEGLPVIGFAVTTYTNGELAGGVLSNYGGTFNHRGSRSIVESEALED